MPKFFEDEDFAELRQLFNDTMDTFAQLTGTYKKDKNTADLWMRDINRKRGTDNVEINILAVWDSDNKEVMDKTASVNLNAGFVLVKFDDCLSNGILSADANKNIKINLPQDSLIFKGIEYSITGGTLIGQWKDEFVLVKFHIQKGLTPNNGRSD